MNKFNISVSTSYLRFIAVLFLLITCISTKNIDSLSNYQDDNDDGETKNVLAPDNLFLLKNVNSRSDHSTIGSDYDLQLQYGQIRIIPFKKRTIPIELQKALYAHGIVGRRR